MHPSLPETKRTPDLPTRTGNAGVVVTATLTSRILGYARDMLIAWSFGAGIYADAFIVAFRLPNLFRRLVGEGALGMAFIPVYQDHARQWGQQRALDLAAVAFYRLTAVAAVLVLIGMIGTPLIVRGLAPGFAVSVEKYQLTVHLTRLMLPYTLLVGLVALSMAVLNARGHFTAPALAPAILNMAMITAIVAGVWLASSMTARASILAIGVVVGGGLQLALQMPVLARHGLRLRPKPQLPTDPLQQFGRLTLPVLLGGATYQVNVLLGTLLASYLAAGSVSYLFYADRLVQFPLGIFAVSAVTLIMPDLSRQASENRLDAIKQTLNESLSMVWFVIVPSMVGLIVLRRPIVSLLFERGAFGSDSAHLTADALLWYSTGLWAYAALRILLAVFYARQDAYRPLIAAGAGVLVNIGAGLLLMPVMGHSGIALAAALAAMVNVGLLGFMLRRQIGSLEAARSLPAVVRIAGCTALMGIVVHWLNNWLTAVAGRGTTIQILCLLVCVMTGVFVYAASSFLCRSREFRTCYQLVLQRGKGS